MSKERESLLDEVIKVVITGDKFKADIFLNVYEGNTDLSLTIEDLKFILAKNKVKYGIKEDVLSKIIETPESFYHRPVLIAVGTPPVHGKDGYVEFVYQGIGKKNPSLKEDGSVDFYNILEISNVKRGQLLAKLIEPTKGTPGKTVTGEDIAPKVGKKSFIKQGKNVLLNAEKNMAYSVMDGQVSITEKTKINVLDIFEVKNDVDFSVGNIDFIGNVVIRGNVLAGFKVKAGGDITIHGQVEGAEIEAGGSITIMGGIFANNKGYIKAGNNVFAKYIQDGYIEALNDVIVSQGIMFCDVIAGKSVTCQSSKGLIVGGKILAGETISARVVGNIASTTTILEVGVNPSLKMELEKYQSQLVQNQEQLQKINQDLKVIDNQMARKGFLTKEKKEMQLASMNLKILAEKKIKELQLNIKEVEENLEDASVGKIEILNTAHNGVKMVFGKHHKTLFDSCGSCKVVYEDMEIKFLPI